MVGLGEIGFPIFRLIKKNFPVIGFDKNKELIPKSKKIMDEYVLDFFIFVSHLEMNFLMRLQD